MLSPEFPRRAASIDIGSNSLLLTIVEQSFPKGPLNILHDEATVTGLAKGLGSDLLIQPDRVNRSLEALTRYRATYEQARASEVFVCATEALRKASNGPEVQKQIENCLQKPVALIGGDREAELSFWSVQKDPPSTQNPKLVFDIGGASTELCLGGPEGVEKKVSLKIGSVLLTERFHLEGPSSAHEAEAFLKDLLQPIDWICPPHTEGIGVAGTMTTLFALHLKMTPYNRHLVHRQKLQRDEVLTWQKKILSLSANERAKLPGLSLDRADVFGGGILIIHALMNHFGWNSLTCYDSGIRFGILYEKMGL